MPWELPITIEDTTYPVRFNTEAEPSQADIDEAVAYITQQRSSPASPAGPPDSGQGRTSSFLSSVGRGAASIVPGVIGGAGYLTGSEGLVDTANTIEAGINRAFPVNPAYEDEFLMKAGQALGQVVPMIVTGGAAGAVGKSMALARGLEAGAAAAKGTQLAGRVMLGSGMLQGTRGGGQAAEQYGMEGGAAYARALLGGAIEGATERYLFGMGSELSPIGRMLGTGGTPGATILRAAGTEGVEEGAAEVGGNLATTALAPSGVQTPGMFANAGEATALGAIAGGAMGGFNAMLSSGETPTTPAEEAIVQTVEGSLPTPIVDAGFSPEMEARLSAVEKALTPTAVSPVGRLTQDPEETMDAFIGRLNAQQDQLAQGLRDFVAETAAANVDVLPATTAALSAPAPATATNPAEIHRKRNAEAKALMAYDSEGLVDRKATQEKRDAAAKAAGMTREAWESEQAALNVKAKEDFFAALNEGDTLEWTDLNGRKGTGVVEIGVDGKKGVRDTTEESPAEGAIYGAQSGVFGQVADALKVTKAAPRKKRAGSPAPVEQPAPAPKETLDQVKARLRQGLSAEERAAMEEKLAQAEDEGILADVFAEERQRATAREDAQRRLRELDAERARLEQEIAAQETPAPPSEPTPIAEETVPPEQPIPTVKEAPAATQRAIAEEDKVEFAELQDLISRRGEAQNKVKGVKFSKKDEARFQELGAKLRRYLFETVDPANDPVVGEDINDQPIRQSAQGTFYIVQNGRIRTGPAFKPDPEYSRQQDEILRQKKAAKEAPTPSITEDKFPETENVVAPAGEAEVGLGMEMPPPKVKNVGAVPTAEEQARWDAVDAYTTPRVKSKTGDELDALGIAAGVKRQGLSDAAYQDKILANTHPDDLLDALSPPTAQAVAEKGTVGTGEIPPIERKKIDSVFERILKRKSTIPLINGMFQVPYSVALKDPSLRPTDRNEQSLRYRTSTKGEVTGDFNARDSRDTIIFDESVRGARAPQKTPAAQAPTPEPAPPAKPGQRDVTKPEQMTPEEYRTADKTRFGPKGQEDVLYEGNTDEGVGKAMAWHERNRAMHKAGFDSGQTIRDLDAGVHPIHAAVIRGGVKSKEPVSKAAVDAYGIAIPEGYVQDGELYVYHPRLAYLKSREVDAYGGTALSDAEDAELAELQGQIAPEPAPPVQRDVTKPEQMTPEEYSASERDTELPKNYVLSDGNGNFVTEEKNGWFRVWRLTGTHVTLAGTVGFKGVEGLTKAKARLKEVSAEMHEEKLKDGLRTKRPVSAAAVDTYQITLPEGYVQDGELYVYRPSGTVEAKPAPPAKPGQRDVTKPEQMTPGELLKGVFGASIQAGERIAEAFVKRLGEWDSLPTNKQTPFMRDRYPDYAYAGRMSGVTGDGQLQAVLRIAPHQRAVKGALEAQKPVSKAAVDAYGITLPTGYVQDGELYVYRPSGPVEAKPAPQPKPAAEVGTDKPAQLDSFSTTLQEAKGEAVEALREAMNSGKGRFKGRDITLLVTPSSRDDVMLQVTRVNNKGEPQGHQDIINEQDFNDELEDQDNLDVVLEHIRPDIGQARRLNAFGVPKFRKPVSFNYRLRLREVGPGTVPAGFIAADGRDVSYDRPLTKQELSDFEMTPVGATPLTTKPAAEVGTGVAGVPPVVAEMFNVANESVASLRGRVSDVKFGPIEKGVETILFSLDGKPYKGALKGRNRDLVLGTGAEQDQAIAVRVLLAKDADPIEFGSTNKVFTKKAKDKAAKNIGGTVNMGGMFNPTILKDVVTVGGFYVEGGVRSFKDFSAKMIEEFGAGIQKYLRPAYDEIRKRTDIDTTGMDPEEGGEAAPKAPEPEAPKPPPAEPPPPVEPPPPPAPAASQPAPLEGPVSVANEPLNQVAEIIGLPRLETPLDGPYRWPQAWEDARAEFETNPRRGEELVKGMIARPRPPTPLEEVILLREGVTRTNAFNAAVDAQSKAPAADQEAANQRVADATNALAEIQQASALMGTLSGRALNFRKMSAWMDFSLANMVTRLQWGKQKELTKEEIKDAQDTHKKITKIEEDIAKTASSAGAEAELTSIFEETFKEAMALSKKNAGDVIVQARSAAKQGKTLKDFLIEQEAAAKKRIRLRGGNVNMSLNPLDALDRAIVMASYMAQGVISLAELTAKMISSFGQDIEKHIPQIKKEADALLEAGQQVFEKPEEGTTKTYAEQLVESQGEDLSDRWVYNRVKEWLVEQGEAGLKKDTKTLLDEVFKVITKEVNAFDPSITEQQLRDMFSGYGKVKFPNPEAAAVKLRQMRRLELLLDKLERARAGVAPLRAGLQRDETTVEEREALKLLNQTMKDLDIPRAPSGANIKTPLDAVKSRLKNSIEDLNKQIKERKRAERPRKDVAYDDEAKALETERDNLQERLDEIDPPRPPTVGERITARLKDLDKQIADLRTKVAAKDYKPKQNETPITEQIQVKTDERDALSQTLKEMRIEAEGMPVLTQEQVNERAQRTLTRQIDELERQIREKDVAPEATLKPEASPALFRLKTKVEALRKQRDQLKEDLGFRRKQKTDDELIDSAVASLEKTIDKLNKQINEGDLSSKARPSRVPEVAKIKNLRAERDSLREEVQRLRKAKEDAAKDPVAEKIKADRKQLQRMIKGYEDRIAKGDFRKRPKIAKVYDDSLMQLEIDLDNIKAEWSRKVFEAHLASRPPLKRMLDTGGQVLNTSRAILTSFDLSAVLRQGGFIGLGNPFRAARNITPMLKAFASDDVAKASLKRLKQRPNWKNYVTAGLYIAETDQTKMSAQEEAFMSRWIDKIPSGAKGLFLGSIVRGSQRAYLTFLNNLRADTFDALVNQLQKGPTPTREEMESIAYYINTSTGRGDLGKGAINQGAVLLNTVFFAPRLVASRFQIIGGMPIFKATGRTKALVLQEYAKFLMGASIVYALAGLAQDDDDEPLELDPRSSDFLKVRYGDTRVDPLGGLIQATVFVSRVVAGETKSAKGKITPIRDTMRLPNLFREVPRTDKVPYGGRNVFNLAADFARTKFSPAFGGAVDIVTGENVIGEAVTPADVAMKMTVPMSFEEAAETLEAHGMPKGPALTVLMTFGAGVMTYNDRK